MDGNVISPMSSNNQYVSNVKNNNQLHNNNNCNYNTNYVNNNINNNNIKLKLHHALGYNGIIPRSTIIHPNLKNYLYIAGSVVVIAELNDANYQEFLRGHDDEITSIAVSNSGNLIASGQLGSNSDLIVWDFKNRSILYRLAEHDFRIDLVKFSQDDKLLYSSGNIDDKKAIIWDTSNGYIVATCSTCPLKSIAMDWGYKVRDNRNIPTDSYQFATCGNSEIYLWELDPFKGLIHHNKIETGNFKRDYISLSFSLNEEKFLYAGSSSGDIVCFLVKTKMIVFSKIICAKGVTCIVPLSVDQIVVGGGDGSLSLCYIKEPLIDILISIELFGSVYSISPSHDAVQLLASTDKGFIYRIRSVDLSYILLNENHTKGIINMYSNQTLEMNNYYDYQSNLSYGKEYNNLTLNNMINSNVVGTTSYDGTIRLWDTNDYSVIFRMYLNQNLTPTCISYSDECLFSGWNDGKIRTYQINNSKELWSINEAHKNGISTICTSKNNKIVCTGGEHGEIRVWEVRSLEMVANLKEHKTRVSKMQLIDNDLNLITAAKDRNILIWDLLKEQRIANYQTSTGGVNDFSLSKQDNNTLITVGQDRRITQWDLRTPKPIKSISSDPMNRSDLADELYAVDISFSNKLFVTGGARGIIRLYDLTMFKFIEEANAHSEACTNIMFLKNDKSIISTGADAQMLTYNLN